MPAHPPFSKFPFFMQTYDYDGLDTELGVLKEIMVFPEDTVRLHKSQKRKKLPLLDFVELDFTGTHNGVFYSPFLEGKMWAIDDAEPWMVWFDHVNDAFRDQLEGSTSQKAREQLKNDHVFFHLEKDIIHHIYDFEDTLSEEHLSFIRETFERWKASSQKARLRDHIGEGVARAAPPKM